MYNGNMRKLNEVIIEKLTTITSKENDALLPCFFILNHITIGTAVPGLVSKDDR